MNQPTYEEHTERCKQKVWPNGSFSSHRCTRKAVKDGFCNQHHPNTVKERDEKQRLKFQEKIDTHPLTIAHKQIEELKQQRDMLLDALTHIANYEDDFCVIPQELQEIAMKAIAKVTK